MHSVTTESTFGFRRMRCLSNVFFRVWNVLKKSVRGQPRMRGIQTGAVGVPVAPKRASPFTAVC